MKKGIIILFAILTLAIATPVMAASVKVETQNSFVAPARGTKFNGPQTVTIKIKAGDLVPGYQSLFQTRDQTPGKEQKETEGRVRGNGRGDPARAGGSVQGGLVERIDDTGFGGYRIIQGDGFSYGVDSVLVSWFMAEHRPQCAAAAIARCCLHFSLMSKRPFTTNIEKKKIPAYGCLVTINTAVPTMDRTKPVTSRCRFQIG